MKLRCGDETVSEKRGKARHTSAHKTRLREGKSCWELSSWCRSVSRVKGLLTGRRRTGNTEEREIGIMLTKDVSAERTRTHCSQASRFNLKIFSFLPASKVR